MNKQGKTENGKTEARLGLNWVCLALKLALIGFVLA